MIHQITNDIKDKSETQCTQDLNEAVSQAKTTYPATKVVISLGTPREDYLKHKVNRVNGMVREMFKDDPQRNGQAKPGLLAGDKYHLTENGTKLVASNIRHAVEPWRRQFSKVKPSLYDNMKLKPSTGEKPSYSGMEGGNPIKHQYCQATGEKPTYSGIAGGNPVKHQYPRAPYQYQYKRDFPVHPATYHASHQDCDERQPMHQSNYIMTRL